MSEPDLGDQLRLLEERLLQPDVRKSRSDLEDLLSDDFVEFASDGRAYDKEQVISMLRQERALRRSISCFRIRWLSRDIAIATYEVERQDGASGGLVRSLRSSIWRRSGDRWQLVFHQGTICSVA